MTVALPARVLACTAMTVLGWKQEKRKLHHWLLCRAILYTSETAVAAADRIDTLRWGTVFIP